MSSRRAKRKPRLIAARPELIRVLRAAEDHRRRIMYTSSPVERALLDSIDALNKEPKK